MWGDRKRKYPSANALDLPLLIPPSGPVVKSSPTVMLKKSVFILSGVGTFLPSILTERTSVLSTFLTHWDSEASCSGVGFSLSGKLCSGSPYQHAVVEIGRSMLFPCGTSQLICFDASLGSRIQNHIS